MPKWHVLEWLTLPPFAALGAVGSLHTTTRGVSLCRKLTSCKVSGEKEMRSLEQAHCKAGSICRLGRSESLSPLLSTPG